MSTILVVEDEPHLASGLRFNLEAEGHHVQLAERGEIALELLAANAPVINCVILDVMLPGMDGFAVASAVRARGLTTPILMLTARGRAEDVLRGFEAGADDYVAKPFERAILLARVQALLRRGAWQRPAPSSDATVSAEAPERFEFSGRVVDFGAQELHVGDAVHPLTLMEVNLLRYLVQHEGQIVSRKRMLEDVWNLREDTDTRAIDHFVARLRKYIEDEPSRPTHLQTVRGVGYRFSGTPKRT